MTDNSEPLADYDLSNVHAIVLLNHLGAPLQAVENIILSPVGVGG